MRGPGSVLDGLPGGVDIGLVGPRQPADDRRRAGDLRCPRQGVAHLGRDAPHPFQVVRRGCREAGLDHVHTQAGQGTGDLQLLG